ncbi:MAG: sigma 54-interacting transcriptional regulator [Polyangiaceae bacterium]
MPVSIGDALLLLETPDGVRASSLAAPSREAPGEAMGALRLLLRRVARSKISVILFGETGVGKELFAESIHRASARSEAAFVRLNCAALPEALLESELFGYERGAFTGAVKSKPGLLEWADGGSLFLDEIGDMTPATQAKLLRVLENGELTRLGGLRAKRIDVRVVCATHRNLLELVGARSFREDLYFRLNGITITVPPLRERTDEILPLAEGFLREASRALGEAAPLLTPAARDKLLRHRWPGNVRELRNTIDRAVVLASGQPLMPDHLALGAVGAAEGRPALRPGDAPAGGLELKDEVRALERHRILEALEATGGNQTRAAQSLNIPRRTLLNRLDAYGILRPRKRAS